MTATGSFISIDRHGIGKTDSDPLSRASFEKSVEQLLTAAVFGETDHMKGVSSRVMVGLVIKGGTGYCDVSLDSDMILNSNYNTSITKTYNNLTTSTLALDVKNNQHADDIFIPE